MAPWLQRKTLAKNTFKELAGKTKSAMSALYKFNESDFWQVLQKIHLLQGLAKNLTFLKVHKELYSGIFIF